MEAYLANTSLGLIAVAESDIESVRRCYTALTPHSGILVWFAFICVDRVLGILASALGEFETADGHFADSVAFCRKAGYRPELSWSLRDYAEMLLERDEPGDQQRVTQLLDESLQVSTDLGMRPLMEKALSKRDILKA